MMDGLFEHLHLLGDFLKGDFKKRFFRCVLVFLAAIALGAAAGVLYPEAVDAVIDQFAQLMEDAGVADSDGNISVFALLMNNWLAMVLSMAYGFIPFLFLPALSLISNGFLVGALGGWYHTQGISALVYAAGILPHGVFELTALLLAIACGVTLCRNMCHIVTNNPQRVPQVELLSDLLRVLLFLIAPLTVVAAFIEAYVTPAILGLLLG
jgi:stage II sporulation protein M